MQKLLEVGHTTFACKIQKSKCVKYNSSYKIEYYCHFA